jgi:hypothetical protein
MAVANTPSDSAFFAGQHLRVLPYGPELQACSKANKPVDSMITDHLSTGNFQGASVLEKFWNMTVQC